MFIQQEFVYVGRRVGPKLDLSYAIRQVNEDGTLAKERWFGSKAFAKMMVGGVYKGAEFSANSVRGHADAIWVRQWQEQEPRIEWRVKDEAVSVRLSASRMEKDAKRQGDIAKMILPLRATYASARQRHDFGLMEALEQSMVRWLRIAPSKTDMEE